MGSFSGWIGLVDFCGGLDFEDMGCFCFFCFSVNDYKFIVFYVDYVENVCVSIDGKL